MQQDSESQPEPESLILFVCWLSLTKLKLKHLQMFLQSAICNLQTHSLFSGYKVRWNTKTCFWRTKQFGQSVGDWCICLMGKYAAMYVIWYLWKQVCPSHLIIIRVRYLCIFNAIRSDINHIKFSRPFRHSALKCCQRNTLALTFERFKCACKYILFRWYLTRLMNP